MIVQDAMILAAETYFNLQCKLQMMPRAQWLASPADLDWSFMSSLILCLRLFILVSFEFSCMTKEATDVTNGSIS